MSFFGVPRPGSMVVPLKGKTSTFLLEGRAENARFARLLVASLIDAEMSCTVLDLDALYSANSDFIFPGSGAATSSFTMRVPRPGSSIEEEFASLFEAKDDAIAIDSLNSLYHLASEGDGSSKGRKIMFAIASLSHLARSNDKAVIMSMYRREGFGRQDKGRAISHLSDLTASVRLTGPALEMSVERGSAWKGGFYSSRIP